MTRPITARAATILGLTVGVVAIVATTAIAIRAMWMLCPIALILLLGGIAWGARADRRLPDPQPDPIIGLDEK